MWRSGLDPLRSEVPLYDLWEVWFRREDRLWLGRQRRVYSVNRSLVDNDEHRAFQGNDDNSGLRTRSPSVRS